MASAALPLAATRIGLGAQEGEKGRRVGAVAGLELARAARGDAREIGKGRPPLPGIPERHPPPPLRLGRAERGHVKGQRPALVLAERAKPHHGRPLHAQRDGAVETVEAALSHALRVVEVAGLGIEAGPRGPIAVAGGAVAEGATLGVERGAPPEIGRALGRHLDPVGGDEGPAQLAGQRGHLRAGALVAHERDEAFGLGFQRRALGPRGQAREEGAGLGHELHLLLVLAVVEHPAVLYRARIVHRHVVENVEDHRAGIGLARCPCLGG